MGKMIITARKLGKVLIAAYGLYPAKKRGQLIHNHDTSGARLVKATLCTVIFLITIKK